MHIMNNEMILKYFDDLGFSPEEKAIYLELVKSKELTALGLSKATGIERTKIYRITEEMLQKGLIFERIDYKRRFFQPCELSTLEHIAHEKITKAQDIKENLPQFLEQLTQYQRESSQTNVKYYYGVSGIKQVLWNQLKAKKEILAYSYRNLQEVVGKKFFYLWEKEIEKKGIVVKDLRSIEFMKSSEHLRPMPFKGDVIRYIEPNILDIITEMDIYNDTVVVFNWFKGDVFAVEIENAKLATMHKQMFKSFWNMATPLNID